MKVNSALNILLMGVIVSLMFTSLTAVLQQEAAAQAVPETHFRGNNLEWFPVSATAATFDATWSSRANGCSPPIGGSYAGGLAVGHICREVVGTTSLDFGDGTNTGTIQVGGGFGFSMWLEVDFVDTPNNFFTGHMVDPFTCTVDASDDLILDGSCSSWTHDYSGSITPAFPGPYTADIASAARTGVEINNPNQSYEVSTLVDFNIPPQPNSSPTTSQQAIQQCPINALCQYQLPIADADGDTLTVRLSLVGEWGADDQPGTSGATTCNNALTVSTSGLVSWDTTACTAGLYSTSQRIEESVGTASPHGYIMVDYLIQLVQQVGNAPVFDVPPMQPDNTAFAVQAGVPITPLPVSCSDVDGGDIVTLGNLGLPAGAALTAQTGTNPGTQTLTYTPAGPGVQIISFTCSDNNGNNAAVHDYIFNISVVSVGGELLPIDSTALILAGAQTNAVWIMSALAVIGSVAFGALYITSKKN